MSNIVDAYYIRKRKLLKMNESNEDRSNSKYCAVLSNNVKQNPTYDNISRFIDECSFSREDSNTYVREIIEAVNENSEKYPQLVNLVCDKIIPNLDDFTINDIREDAELMQNKTIYNFINFLCEMDLVVKRTVENHSKILEVYNTEELIWNNRNVDDTIIIDKVASVINEFDLPVYGKFATTIEELSYIYPDLEKDILVNEAYEYFCLSCNPSITDREAMKNVVANSPVIPDDIRINEGSITNGTVQKMCLEYVSSDNHTLEELISLKDNVINGDIYAFKKGIGNFLELLSKIVSSSTNRDIIEATYKTIIPGLKDEIIDRLSREPEGMAAMIAISHDIQRIIQDCEDRYDILSDHNGTDIYQFTNALKILGDYISDSIDIFYPTYNIECMTSPLNESTVTISLQEFKLFKFDNLVTRLWKVDKFLQKKFNQFKNKVKAKVYKVRSKIFENSDIYEFLDINGNIDYCISSFAYSPDADMMQIHEYCVSSIREINNTLLNDSEYVCYYEITGDTIEFRIRSNNIAISLTEKDQSVLEEYLSYESMDRASDIMLIGDLLDENFNFVRDSVKYFSKKENYDKFGTFLELCSVAGIDKEAITEIYDGIKVSAVYPTQFIVTNSYLYDSYKPTNYNLVEVSFEALIGIETLITEGSNLSAAEKRRQTLKKKKEEQLRKWEEEEENGSDDDDESVVDKAKNAANNLKNTVKSNAKDIRKNIDKNVEKKTGVKDATKKGMSLFNKIKLYGHGLMQYAKTAGNKIKTKIMDMNSSSDRLGKAIKSALVSDRKEAIIKGSIIPSFHRCVAIAVGLAGLWTFNPPLAIIAAVGDFAASKNLTKKERALMYDDIMIELKIVDKELQAAEDNNQLKKMRELMRMKKELERTAARIKYGAVLGKDLIPGGRTMFPTNED